MIIGKKLPSIPKFAKGTCWKAAWLFIKLSAVETFRDIRSAALLAVVVGLGEAAVDWGAVSLTFVGGLSDAATDEVGGGMGLGTLVTVVSIDCLDEASSFSLCSYKHKKISINLMNNSAILFIHLHPDF